MLRVHGKLMSQLHKKTHESNIGDCKVNGKIKNVIWNDTSPAPDRVWCRNQAQDLSLSYYGIGCQGEPKAGSYWRVSDSFKSKRETKWNFRFVGCVAANCGKKYFTKIAKFGGFINTHSREFGIWQLQRTTTGFGQETGLQEMSWLEKLNY